MPLSGREAAGPGRRHPPSRGLGTRPGLGWAVGTGEGGTHLTGSKPKGGFAEPPLSRSTPAARVLRRAPRAGVRGSPLAPHTLALNLGRDLWLQNRGRGGGPRGARAGLPLAGPEKALALLTWTRVSQKTCGGALATVPSDQDMDLR